MENGLLSWSDFPPIYSKIAVRIFYGVIDLTNRVDTYFGSFYF